MDKDRKTRMIWGSIGFFSVIAWGVWLYFKI